SLFSAFFSFLFSAPQFLFFCSFVFFLFFVLFLFSSFLFSSSFLSLSFSLCSLFSCSALFSSLSSSYLCLSFSHRLRRQRRLGALLPYECHFSPKLLPSSSLEEEKSR